MFLDLFYGLRKEGVPVSIQEWRMLMTALERGLHGSNLLSFYHLSRATLVKSEIYFDAFDRVFASVFHGVEGELSLSDELEQWLNDPKQFDGLTDEQRAQLERLDADELMRKFLETLDQQDERHDGGGRWVGTGGHSPFGHGGEHPTGIRVGGESRSRSAMKVAEDRRFEDYRTDSTLDLRQTKVALKRLRHLTRSGPYDHLDIDESVNETCKNGGDIEVVFSKEKRNNMRLLLLMDVGGTMDPYHAPVSRLVTALHEERGLRDFRAYYFHNCIYDTLGKTARLYAGEPVPTGELFRVLDERWRVLIVGDAAMHPAELMNPRGNINPRYESETRGVDWLVRISNYFDRTVWLNPDPPKIWGHSQTCQIIQRFFPMFHLSVDGIEEAVRALVGSRPGTSVH